MGASWSAPEAPVSMGSLIKPFVMLSYAATHDEFPLFCCGGSRDGCWLAVGHGRLDVESALAQSCNAYFSRLAAATDRVSIDAICMSYGLRPPLRTWNTDRFIGLGVGWPQSPEGAARAYARMFDETRADLPGIALVRSGMARCAAAGTARSVAIRCYAKTGTAPCSHMPKGAGDGFTLAIYPIEQPRRVLLVREHNKTGADSAAEVGRLIAKVVS